MGIRLCWDSWRRICKAFIFIFFRKWTVKLVEVEGVSCCCTDGRCDRGNAASKI